MLQFEFDKKFIFNIKKKSYRSVFAASFWKPISKLNPHRRFENADIIKVNLPAASKHQKRISRKTNKQTPQLSHDPTPTKTQTNPSSNISNLIIHACRKSAWKRCGYCKFLNPRGQGTALCWQSGWSFRLITTTPSGL